MALPSMVTIMRSEDAAALRKRLDPESTILVFPESEVLLALEAIRARRPKVLLLDPLVVTTSRGAMLVSQVKGDPTLSEVDVRVLNKEDGPPALARGRRPASLETMLLKTSEPLHHCGTRRAVRWHVAGEIEIVVNGKSGHLVNVSTIGAQVVAPTPIRPLETVRFSVLDGEGDIRLRARVAWCSAETVESRVQYRAGLEFVDGDPELIDVLCLRYAAVR